MGFKKKKRCDTIFLLTHEVSNKQQNRRKYHMRKETLKKKITLKKVTVAHLETKLMGNVKGGDPLIIFTMALTRCMACTLTVKYTDCPEC